MSEVAPRSSTAVVPLARLLDVERRARLAAVDDVPGTAAAAFALRSVLVTDEDAVVRARAAERLGKLELAREASAAREAVIFGLREALGDPSAPVREAAAISLGRLRAGEATTVLAEMTRLETEWRPRRAAVRALGAMNSDAARAPLIRALGDPFWRVRHAAIQALVDRPDLAPRLAAERRNANAAARDAIAYLERVWTGAPGDVTPAAESSPAAQASGELVDPDPAVTTILVERSAPGAVGAETLVAFLRDPHEPLRSAATRRLIALVQAGALDATGLEPVIELLDDPRVPYVVAAALDVLGRIDAKLAAARVLERADSSPGAVAWALGQDVEPDLLRSAARRALDCSDVRVRRAAAETAAALGDRELLGVAAKDPDDAVVATAVAGLVEIDARALDCGRLDLGRVHVARAATSAAQRCAERDPTWAREIAHRAASADPPDVRAAAVRLARRLGAISSDVSRASADDDPLVRAAALDSTAACLAAMEHEQDPGLRRDAAASLKRAASALDPDVRARTAELFASDADPWIRAAGVELWRLQLACSPGGDDAFERLLALSRDSEPMVRVAVADVLDAMQDLRARCDRTLSRPCSQEVRLAAWAQRLRDPDEATFDELAREIASRDAPDADRELLASMTLVFSDDVRARGPAIASAPRERPAKPASRAATAAHVERRALGRTGLAVAPLGLSGAFDLPRPCFDEALQAGVNLLFWEPEYLALGEAIRTAAHRDDLVVVAGSYHADARAIEKDVHTAVRRLRIEALGVMLLFWVRSAARLSDEAASCLDRLRQAGTIRAFGFSTHLRDLACDAIRSGPWQVVMTRHSAAHPGAEEALLPAARERDVGVLTFSALTYGRMLAPPARGPRFGAADCYRYTLGQPGVSACISAPRRRDELLENLEALRQPSLAPDEVERLRAHGKLVRMHNVAFNTLVRKS